MCVACYNAGSNNKCIFRKCMNWGKATFVRSKSTGDADEEKEEDNHEHDCNVCGQGGDVICCDKCTKVYHSICHTPKLYNLPEGEWLCMICTPPKEAQKNLEACYMCQKEEGGEYINLFLSKQHSLEITYYPSPNSFP